MPLNDELKILHKEILESLPVEVRKTLINENKKIINNFIEAKTLKVGSIIPDVHFRNKDLQPVYLTDLLKNNHLVLSFFRGTWCPYCNLELISLAKINNEIEKRGARLISVSPELYKYSKDSLESNNINFSVYTDLANKAADKFGLVFNLPPAYREMYKTFDLHLDVRNNDNEWTLPVPATFVISKDGVVTAKFVNADYTKRMEPDDILKELDALS